MMKLDENRVWLFASSENGYERFICNYGSKSNFIKLIQSIKTNYSVNWIKDRIMISANDFQLELSKNYPNSFIYYTVTKQWSEEGFEIKEIKTKTPTESILQKKKKLDDAIADFIKNNPDGEKIVSNLLNNKTKN